VVATGPRARSCPEPRRAGGSNRGYARRKVDGRRAKRSHATKTGIFTASRRFQRSIRRAPVLTAYSWLVGRSGWEKRSASRAGAETRARRTGDPAGHRTRPPAELPQADESAVPEVLAKRTRRTAVAEAPETLPLTSTTASPLTNKLPCGYRIRLKGAAHGWNASSRDEVLVACPEVLLGVGTREAAA
jgi:hypothetical protein